MLPAPLPAQAQQPSSYPDRPIRLVVAFVPGGATDNAGAPESPTT